MVLIIDNQGLVGEVILGVVGDGVVEDTCNSESKVKACFTSSTDINGDCCINGDYCFNFTRGFAHCSDNISINTDRFVTGGFVVQIIIEIAEMTLERRVDEAVADFHGYNSRMEFSVELGNYL